MKQYFVRHGEFYNAYDLVYVTEAKDVEAAIAEGYERITRKEAERLCVAERRRRKEDTQFSGLASAWIHPYFEDSWRLNFENYPHVTNGYLVERV